MKYKLRKNVVLLAFGYCLAVTSPSFAAVELMDLISSNGSIVSGNMVFDQFSVVASGDISADTIVNVQAIVDHEGNFGLRFQGGLDDLAGDGPSTWSVSYHASFLDDSVFTGAVLAANPSAPISGSGVVTLSAAQIDSSEYLTVFDDFDGGTNLLDSGSFANPTASLDVTVDFVADAENRGGVTASFIDTTFRQEGGVVPELSSLTTWMVLLFGVTVIVGWRKLCGPQDLKNSTVSVPTR